MKSFKNFFADHKLWENNICDCEAYIRVPIKGYVKNPIYRKLNMKLRVATDEDLDFCFNWANEYNKKYNIDFIDDELLETCNEIMNETGCFILVELNNKVVAVTDIIISELNVESEDFKGNKLFGIGNIMVKKDIPDMLDLCRSVLGELLNALNKLTDWKGHFWVSLDFYVGSFVGGSLFEQFYEICTLYCGRSDDNFAQIVCSAETVKKSPTGYGYTLPSTDRSLSPNQSIKIFECAMLDLIKDYDSCMPINCDFSSYENLDFFLTDEYKNEMQVTLPIDILTCNVRWSRDIRDKQIVERYENDGFYYPLVITTSKEVVINHTTYWLLKEKGVQYVRCIFKR